MRVNPENLIQATDGENASSFYLKKDDCLETTARRLGESLNLNERICIGDVDELHHPSPRRTPKYEGRQEEMRAAAVRTMVASGTAKSPLDSYEVVERESELFRL